jgi:hypothetical protein
LAETQPEQGRVGELLTEQFFRDFRGQTVKEVKWRVFGARQPKKKPVVGVVAGRNKAEPLPDAASQDQSQGVVHLAAKGRQDSQPVIAGGVRERLNQDRAIIGHNACNALLPGDVRAELARGIRG